MKRYKVYVDGALVGDFKTRKKAEHRANTLRLEHMNASREYTIEEVEK